MQRLEKKKEKVVRSLGQLIGYGCHHEGLKREQCVRFSG